MTNTEITEVVSRIRCFDRRFVLTMSGSDLFVHVEYEEPDVDRPGSPPVTQKSRRWLIERDSSETDVVNTCFGCVMRSYDHVVKEHFTYCGFRVFSPHTSIEKRIEASKS